ncbi:Hypothetical protein R9X50_00753800 [Acrodontium crateriforme]|uniref:G-patch domain-containing protein n=1 Tax=Acrodontium crateriforme TaxID=150365 RepID=A0AAQ3MBC3_9PEZI|nr:Hypothetical protein R9X50_00753800 [Acrodontium crateriforme]
MTEPDGDEYEVPLRDQRYFGAGIKRKRVQFVPSSSGSSNVSPSSATKSSTSAADKYLSIVFNKASSTHTTASAGAASGSHKIAGTGSVEDSTSDTPTTLKTSTSSNQDHKELPTLCEICEGPIYASAPHAHESSIAHQVRVQHSHPPSHLDRSRKGLAVMQTYGWDPDSRRGLGVGGQGVLHPIKAISNLDRRGLGAKFAKSTASKEKTPTLDAGKAKLLDVANKQKAQSLRNTFFRSEEVEKYLGEQEHAENDGHLDLEAFRQTRRR